MTFGAAEYIGIAAIIIASFWAAYPILKQRKQRLTDDLEKLSQARDQLASLENSEDYTDRYVILFELKRNSYLEQLEHLCESYCFKTIKKYIVYDLSFVQKHGLVDSNKMEEPWLNIKKMINKMK